MSEKDTSLEFQKEQGNRAFDHLTGDKGVLRYGVKEYSVGSNKESYKGKSWEEDEIDDAEGRIAISILKDFEEIEEVYGNTLQGVSKKRDILKSGKRIRSMNNAVNSSVNSENFIDDVYNNGEPDVDNYIKTESIKWLGDFLDIVDENAKADPNEVKRWAAEKAEYYKQKRDARRREKTVQGSKNRREARAEN